jgi:hypothetical protein
MIKKNLKRGQLNISFGWIFAIIVGGFILFLVIYGIIRFSNLQDVQQSAETSRQIEVLLNPLETSFESGQKVLISTPVPTRISLQCNSEQGIFGRQRIRTQQEKFGNYGEDENSVNVVLEGKYIFSERIIQGEKFYAFSKPYELPFEESYEFPFKVSDLIYLTSSDDNYCFVDSPEKIEREISDLDQDNLFVDNCPSESSRICFSSSESNCGVSVNYNNGIVDKGSEKVYFEGDALMYAAIFSSPGEYECQLNRLMKRAEQLTIIYEEKSSIQRKQGCPSGILSHLNSFENFLSGFENSRDIFSVGNRARELNRQNSILGECRLW